MTSSPFLLYCLEFWYYNIWAYHNCCHKWLHHKTLLSPKLESHLFHKLGIECYLLELKILMLLWQEETETFTEESIKRLVKANQIASNTILAWTFELNQHRESTMTSSCFSFSILLDTIYWLKLGWVQHRFVLSYFSQPLPYQGYQQCQVRKLVCKIVIDLTKGFINPLTILILYPDECL